MKKAVLGTLIVSTLGASFTTHAFESGEIIVRGGLVTVAPDESTSNVIVGGNDQGFGLEVDDNTQLMLNLAYFLNSSFSVELLAATPFSHDVNFAVSDPLGTGNQLGEVKHLPPTLSLNYYLPVGSENIKPYVGAGLNYTVFFDEEFTGTNRAAGLSDLELDASFGWAVQIGVDYLLNDRWFLNGSIRMIDIDTDASFNLNGTPGSVNSIEIDPWVYSAGIGYRF
jgi:outer membrane protein